MSNFEIRAHDENKGKTVPPHFDIHIRGDEDSLITVWAEREMAEEIIQFLDSRGGSVARQKIV